MVSSHWLVAVRFSGDFLNGKKARRASSLPAPNGGSLFRRSPYSGYGEYATLSFIPRTPGHRL